MSTISRTYTFTDGTTAYGSQVESEISNIVSTWNNHDAGTSIFTAIKAAGLTMSGAIAMGSNKITGGAAATAATDLPIFSQLKVFQTVSFTTTSSTATTSSTFTSTVITLAITPTSASNKILVFVSTEFRSDSATTSAIVTLDRGGTNLGDATNGLTALLPSASAACRVPMSIIYLDSPATTSSTTYTVQARSSNNVDSVRVNQNGGKGSIILMEVA